MGGKSTLIKEYSQPGLKNFTDNFIFNKSLNDSKFGQIHVFKEKSTNKYIALSDKISSFPEKIQHYKGLINFHKSLRHPSLLRLIGYTLRQEENVCSSTDVITLYFEWFQHDMKMELQERSARKVGSYLESKEIYHGDIRPETVILSEDGDIFIADHSFINPDHDNWGKFQNGNSEVYLSPEQLQELKAKATFPEYDVYKADVFSFGMTLLYAMNLRNPIGAYDYSALTINKEAVDAMLIFASQKYSSFMAEFLKKTLEFKVEERPNFRDLESFLEELEKRVLKEKENRSEQDLRTSGKTKFFNERIATEGISRSSILKTLENHFEFEEISKPNNPNGNSSNFKLNGIELKGPHNFRRKY